MYILSISACPSLFPNLSSTTFPFNAIIISHVLLLLLSTEWLYFSPLSTSSFLQRKYNIRSSHIHKNTFDSSAAVEWDTLSIKIHSHTVPMTTTACSQYACPFSDSHSSLTTTDDHSVEKNDHRLTQSTTKIIQATSNNCWLETLWKQCKLPTLSTVLVHTYICALKVAFRVSLLPLSLLQQQLLRATIIITKAIITIHKGRGLWAK